jgi:hypothetical protein
MYRYEPPEQPDPKGSWREILQLCWIAMSIVLPVVALVLGVMLLVAIFFWFLSIHPALTLVPVGLLVIAALGVIFIDRRNQARLARQAAERPDSFRRG